MYLFCLYFNRKANLILRRVEKISHYCRSLLHSTHIQSRTDTMAYVYCRSEEGRPPSNTWHSSLHDSRTTCMEKLISVQRNTYSSTKLRWDRSWKTCLSLYFPCKVTSVIDVPHWSTLRQVSLLWLVHFKNQETLTKPQNTLDIVVKLPKTYFCVAYFYYRRGDLKNMARAYFIFQWQTAVWTCKISFSEREKNGWLKYFECNIVVPFGALELTWNTCKREKNKLSS